MLFSAEVFGVSPWACVTKELANEGVNLGDLDNFLISLHLDWIPVIYNFSSQVLDT